MSGAQFSRPERVPIEVARAAKLGVSPQPKLAKIEGNSKPEVDSYRDYGYTREMVTTVAVAERWGTPLSDYVSYLRASKSAKSTLSMRSYQIRKLSSELGGTPEEVTRDMLVQYLASKDGQWADNYMHGVRSAIRGFYTWMHETERMDHDPSVGLPKVPVKQGKPRPVNPKLVAEAIANAPERTRWMILFGVYVGLRRHEIAKVHTRDLIQDSDGGYSLRINGKGNKDRIVPLVPVLAGYLQSIQPGWAFPSYHRGHNDGTPSDKHLQADAVGKAISKAFQKGASSHQLRHRFASDLYLAAQNNIRVVQEALGHSSVATTQIYTEVPRDALRQGVDGLHQY